MSPNRCLVVLPCLLSGGYAIVSTKLCTLKGTGLNSTASIALSGMNAAQTQLRASAHNVANLGTDGFRRRQVSGQSGGFQDQQQDGRRFARRAGLNRWQAAVGPGLRWINVIWCSLSSNAVDAIRVSCRCTRAGGS